MMQTTPFIVRLSHTLLSIGLIILFMYIAKSVLVPLIFASLLCIVLMVPCDYMERHRMPRSIAAIICLVLAITVVFTIFYFISSQIINFRDDLPKLGQQLFDGIHKLQLWIQQQFHLRASVVKNYLNSATSNTLAHTSALLGTTFSTVGSTLIYLVLIPIYTFLLLLYRNMIVSFLLKSFSEQHSPVVHTILNKTKAVIKGYIVGLGIEMLIVATMIFVGFTVLGVKYALLLAMIVAVLNLIPYLGIFTALLLSVLITFTTNAAGTVLGVAIVVVCTHLIDSNFLLPKVVGSKVKINALVTILGVILGEHLWGISGMFLAIPVIALLKVVFDSVDTLNAWGFILGDEVVISTPGKKIFSVKKKVIKPADTSTVEQLEE
ncbi:AI-2E family transporter [Ilyomonas limi]|uniref:AI-2E family transporter n=1 Tax=Ilyomonas limi TaxID=2575867 RepID=A0A4U3KUB5_9BACT|nr:AI-2E family transporter [Ilyomonas limi]TKK66011.1 AI-2E family transporter [Ilyomonas limi]